MNDATSITVDTAYRSIGAVPVSVWEAEFKRLSSPLLPHVGGLHAGAGVHSALALAMMYVENKYGTASKIIRPDDFNPMSLRPWPADPRAVVTGDILDWQTRQSVGTIRVPPGASGAIRDSLGGLSLRFDTPEDGMREWVRRIITDPKYKNGVYVPATSIVEMIRIYAPKTDKHPVSGAYNDPEAYAATVVAMLKRYAAMVTDSPDTGGGTDMVYSTVIPGLQGGALSTSFPIRIGLISASRTYMRPGIKLRGAFDTTQHNTDNWNSLAPSEANYFRNGAEGRQASVHGCIDDAVLEILLPLDEVGYHASDGAGPGNYSTVAVELCMQRAMVNDAARWRRARRNAAEFMGKVAARKGGDRKGSYHRTYAPDRKNCPSLILGNATWEREYQSDYGYFYDMEKAAMGGGGAPLPVIGINDVVKTTVGLNLRQAANPASPSLGVQPVGTELTVTARYVDANGYRWLPVKQTAGALFGFVAMGGEDGAYVELFTDNPDPEKPVEYADVAPIPALLETDLQKYDSAPRITSDDNGNDFIFIADLVEFIAVTDPKQFAGKGAKNVGPAYKVGERALAAWLVKTESEGWWYVLAGPGDEWVRIPYASVKPIADAGVPMLGKEWEVKAT